MKLLVTLLALAFLVVPAEAKKKKRNEAARKAAQREEQQKKKEQAERDRIYKAYRAYMDKKDANGDGSLTKDEFLKGEGDAEAASRRFDRHNKNGDRYLTRSEVEDLLGLR